MVHERLVQAIHTTKRARELHTVVQSFFTPAPVMACLYGESEYSGREKGAVS